MATDLPLNITFDKMAQFDKVATKILQTFDSLIDQLIARRDVLLQRVQEVREEHRNKEATRIAAIEELKMVQQKLQEISIKVNPNVEFHQQAKEAYQQGLKKHEPPATFLCPIFRCQRINTIRELIAEFGEIVQCEILDYSLKKDPILTVDNFGRVDNTLDARGIASDDTTELIYITDYGNSRVQIASKRGEFVKQFGNDKLLHPWGIAVTNECIFVTDTTHHALFQFRKKDFKFLNSIGTKGYKEGQLNWPRGLCIDTNGDVLLAESCNDRVSVFSKQLKFKICIGIGQLYSPKDVKLSADRVVVLDNGNKCVHFFSREGNLLSSCISQGITQDSSVISPFFLCLDAANNIIISDYDHHTVKVFTELGRLIHTIGRKGERIGEFINPFGVCISKLGAIFILSNNPNYSLQYF